MKVTLKNPEIYEALQWKGNNLEEFEELRKEYNIHFTENKDLDCLEFSTPACPLGGLIEVNEYLVINPHSNTTPVYTEKLFNKIFKKLTNPNNKESK